MSPAGVWQRTRNHPQQPVQMINICCQLNMKHTINTTLLYSKRHELH